jgi:hypothetical protein
MLLLLALFGCPGRRGAPGGWSRSRTEHLHVEGEIKEGMSQRRLEKDVAMSRVRIARRNHKGRAAQRSGIMVGTGKVTDKKSEADGKMRPQVQVRDDAEVFVGLSGCSPKCWD